MIRKHILMIMAALAALMTACIEDGVSTSPADQPAFSTDTLRMGTIFTDEQSATHRFTVYNNHSKGINISNISMSGDNASLFRLNVDGMSGKTFTDVEIRANDSIFVFVSADLPVSGTGAPRRIEAGIDFTVCGKVTTMPIAVDGQDIVRLKGKTITEDTRLAAGMPYQVRDSLIVAEGVTLTLDPGVEMLFHDGASMTVRGRLRAEGTAQQPVKLTGDRMGNVITDVSFGLMSRQWGGIVFDETSHDNYMAYTEVSNTSWGVFVYGDGQNVEARKLTLINSRLRNSGATVLTAIGASVEAYGCEFAEASNNLVSLLGGDHRFDQCTAANYYLFSYVSGAAFMFPDFGEEYQDYLPTRALVTNTIIYGLGADVTPGDLTGTEIYFRRCLFKSKGEDDDNFTDSLWDADPLYYTVRSDYIFDYRVKPESPAIGAAYPYLSEYPLDTDFYGVPRNNDLGAYVYVDPEE